MALPQSSSDGLLIARKWIRKEGWKDGLRRGIERAFELGKVSLFLFFFFLAKVEKEINSLPRFFS